MGKGVDERGVAANEYRIPLGDDKKKNVLKLDSGDDCMTLQIN